MITLYLIVANPVYRESLAVTLSAPGFQVVGTCGSGENPLSPLDECSPDVVLLDLPASDGLPLLRALRYQCPRPAVVVLGRSVDEGERFLWQREGAAGLVLATESLHQLVLVIERVAEGDLQSQPLHPRPAIPLTDREREIVYLIDRGLSNKEIAATLGIQLSTVKNHVHHILEKLKARRRSEAAAQVAGRREAL
jgi:two-component system, NarL family, nitrate/nitrite response regulator NarL